MQSASRSRPNSGRSLEVIDVDVDGYQPLPTSEEAVPDDGKKVVIPFIPGKTEERELTCGEAFLEDNRFQSCMALLIVGNAAVIGLETDLPGFTNWDLVENLFLLLFSIELLLKFLFVGPMSMFSFYNPDFTWNSFDFFIVGLGIFDFVMSTLCGSKGGGFATIFRMIRLLRILRIFRIIKFLKQLYLLAFGLVEATKAVFWVAILMCFVLYVCSIVLVKTIGRPPETDAHFVFLDRHYGSILESMLTLFILMSSPNLPVYQDEIGLLEEKPIFTLFLCGFITFGSYGIIAMLTGVINESMFEKNEIRKEEQRAEHEEIRDNLGVHARALFSQCPMDESRSTKTEELLKLGHDIAGLVDAAGGNLTHADIERMIMNMDTGGDGTIDEAEFVQALETIAEGMSPLGIQEIHHSLGNVQNDLTDLHSQINAINQRTQQMMTMMHRLAGDGVVETTATGEVVYASEFSRGSKETCTELEDIPEADTQTTVPMIPRRANRRSTTQNTMGGRTNTDIDSEADTIGGTDVQKPMMVQADLDNIRKMLCEHVATIHAELARQCKELTLSQERAFHGFSATLNLAEVPSTFSTQVPEVPGVVNWGGLTGSNANTTLGGWSYEEKKAVYGNGNVDAAYTQPTKFVDAVQAAAVRAGLLTPEALGEVNAGWRPENFIPPRNEPSTRANSKGASTSDDILLGKGLIGEVSSGESQQT